MPDHPLRFAGSGALRARVEEDAETLTLALAGELDLAVANEVTTLLRELEATAPRELVIDLVELTFMDSSGVRMLLQAQGRARDGGHRLVVRDGTGPAHRTLQLVDMDGAFPRVDSSGG